MAAMDAATLLAGLKVALEFEQYSAANAILGDLKPMYPRKEFNKLVQKAEKYIKPDEQGEMPTWNHTSDDEVVSFQHLLFK